jgi:hypothetical protein
MVDDEAPRMTSADIYTISLVGIFSSDLACFYSVPPNEIFPPATHKTFSIRDAIQDCGLRRDMHIQAMGIPSPCPKLKKNTGNWFEMSSRR